VAKWDGTNWSALGSGITTASTVLAIRSHGNDIYAGGGFTVAGSDTVKNVAKWDGITWQNMGSGANNQVMALATTVAGEIYVGGVFTQAGDKISNRLGLWDNGGALPVELTTFTARLENKQVLLQWATASETNNYGFAVERQINIPGADETESAEWLDRGFAAGQGTSVQEQAYQFSDDIAELGALDRGSYLQYRLKQIDLDGSFEYHQAVTVAIATLPETSVLLNQNYPNPFNPTTTIEFSLPGASRTMLKIYNLNGREVSTLVDGILDSGTHRMTFDASALPAGTYFYTIRTAEPVTSKTRRMLLVK
jgi:hypothetical protein